VVRYGGKTQAQEVMSQSSYVSANDPRLHFGLGAEKSADIEVRWPLGAMDTFKDIAANQLVTIREGTESAKGTMRLQSLNRI
jgi:enediyne biosynthesis protein E4